jgi:hypothetical protein
VQHVVTNIALVPELFPGETRCSAALTRVLLLDPRHH